MTPTAEGPFGLYVHVPFCEAKCTYCHFAIDPRSPDLKRQERYVRAVTVEMDRAEAVEADTLYLGGGTPTLLTIDRVARLVEKVRSRFQLPRGAEVTVEANPRDVDLAGYRALLSAGVSRVSLGFQSLDDVVLREMGRRHSASDSVRAFRLAREAGIEAISVDLVLGWPGETRERWGRSLAPVLALRPEHVSLYLLEVEARTVLAYRQRQGRLELPDEDEVADLYRETVDELGASGLVRYEISNFAREGFASLHNRKYWDESPFLGFGMSAHSYRGERRWWNLDRYATYCRAVEEGRDPVEGGRLLGPREKAQEALFTGLRRVEGIDLDAFRRRHGIDPCVEWAEPLDEVARAGLVEAGGPRLRLTDQGILLANEVFRIFV